MSQGSRPRDELATAFRDFERAAGRLRLGQGALRRQVERLERQLLDAHRQLEAVVDALEPGVAVLSAEGKVLRSNRAFDALQRAGDGDGALAGCFDATASMRKALRVRQPTVRGIRDLAVTVQPVGDAGGTRVLTVQDLTEVRRQEEEGGRKRRLEALGRMAAELAHEVRNPLGSIRLFAAMLRDDLLDRPPQREMAEQILDATSSLEATVSNLLAFASPPRTARREVDLAALAVDTCAMLEPTCALRGVSVEGPERGSCPVTADPEAMRQVLLNLLGNALAATGEGGRIQVRTGHEGRRAVLEVLDTGQGIAPEDLARVFDPFFSRFDNGTGLGLSVVHRIAERHGGRIAVESSLGQGTRARLEIPLGPVAGADA